MCGVCPPPEPQSDEDLLEELSGIRPTGMRSARARAVNAGPDRGAAARVGCLEESLSRSRALGGDEGPGPTGV